MRAFVGLPLPDAVSEALEQVQSDLPVRRHVPAENLHVTLAFLDDQPEGNLAALHEDLEGLNAARPELRITGLEVFGGKSARLVAAVVAPDPALVALRTRVRGAARAMGIELFRERFRPHITLARFRQRKAPGEMEKLQDFMAHQAALRLPPVRLDRFCLYRSSLTPDGAIYDPLASYPLG